MPVRRDRDGVTLAHLGEHGTARGDELVRVEVVVRKVCATRLRIALGVKRDRADR
jgi:hypothetical protein